MAIDAAATVSIVGGVDDHDGVVFAECKVERVHAAADTFQGGFCRLSSLRAAVLEQPLDAFGVYGR